MISNERVKHIFSGNGSSKKFQIPFDFFQNAAGVFDKNNQITVILTNSAGTETTLTEDTDYEVETHDRHREDFQLGRNRQIRKLGGRHCVR